MDWDKGHPNDDAVERYSLGALEPEEEAAFEEHLLLCEFCQQRVSDADDYVRAMRTAATRAERAIPAMTRPPMARSLPIPLAGALAAGLLAVVFVAPRPEPVRGSAEITLAATRGSASRTISSVTAPANHRISMRLDAYGLVPRDRYLVRLVDAAGTTLLEAPAAIHNGALQVDYPAGCKPGQYWVRVFGPRAEGSRDELLREFGFQVRDGGSQP
jgi:hypothetical protein